jgi:hypothetical protein
MVHMHPQRTPEPDHGSGAYALVRIPDVPNQPKNKNKPVRVSEELWAEFGEACEADGTDRAKDLRAHMERKVKAYRRKKARQTQQDTTDL